MKGVLWILKNHIQLYRRFVPFGVLHRALELKLYVGFDCTLDVGGILDGIEHVPFPVPHRIATPDNFLEGYEWNVWDFTSKIEICRARVNREDECANVNEN